jgi:hypothetical protein
VGQKEGLSAYFGSLNFAWISEFCIKKGVGKGEMGRKVPEERKSFSGKNDPFTDSAQ